MSAFFHVLLCFRLCLIIEESVLQSEKLQRKIQGMICTFFLSLLLQPPAIRRMTIMAFSNSFRSITRFMTKAPITKNRLTREKHTIIFNITLCDSDTFEDGDPKEQVNLYVFMLVLMKSRQLWVSVMEPR